MKKLLLLTSMLLVALAFGVRAQQNGEPFNNTGAWSGAAEICHIVSGNGAPTLSYWGLHAANTSGSTVYLAVWPNLTAKPADTTVIPGGGWKILANSDIDVSSVSAGIPASGGLIACLSTSQGTFTAATAVGYFWVTYKGFISTPTQTATPTATPT